MNSSAPLDLVFRKTAAPLAVAVIRSPPLTGSMYPSRFPPLSQPLPYSSASARCIEAGTSATRYVGGASVFQRGLGSPIASVNRFRWPASTVAEIGATVCPIRERRRSTAEVVAISGREEARAPARR